jgi:hypothetical protein
MRFFAAATLGSVVPPEVTLAELGPNQADRFQKVAV